MFSMVAPESIVVIFKSIYLLSAGSGLMVTVACVEPLPKKAGSKDERVTEKDSLPSRISSSITGTK